MGYVSELIDFQHTQRSLGWANQLTKTYILALQTKWSAQAIKNLKSSVGRINKDGLAKNCSLVPLQMFSKSQKTALKTRMDAFIGKETPAHKHEAKKMSRITYWSGTQEMSPNKTKSLAQGQRKTESTVLLPVPFVHWLSRPAFHLFNCTFVKSNKDEWCSLKLIKSINYISIHTKAQ